MKTRYFISALVIAAGIASFSSCKEIEPAVPATGDIITSITTDGAVPTAVTASLSGSVKDLSSQQSGSYGVGFVYGTSENPTVGGTKQVGSFDVATGAVTASLSGLKEGTTYYYATYVTLQDIVTLYGDVKSFTATDAAVLTNEATAVTATTAILNGQASGIGDNLDKVTVGFKLAGSAEEVLASVHDKSFAAAAAGTFDCTFAGLLPGITYYYAAYAVIDGDTQFGDVLSFTTENQQMEYVDLGLDVLWAKYNVGAETETATGAMVGFGDITGLNVATSLSAYPAAAISETENDIALALFGSSSAEMNCIPTAADYEQLFSKTTQTWETVDGVAGIRFTAKNGNSIFMPAAGYRNGTEVLDADAFYYWSGDLDDVNSVYAKAASAKADGTAALEISKRIYGMPVRSIQRVLEHDGLVLRNGNLVQGDIEGKGNYRLELYNAYGATKDAPVVNPADVVFENNIKVTFSITGIPEGKSYKAYYIFASSDWSLGHWEYMDKVDEAGTASCIIDKDGTYSLILHGAANGVQVFCIDIAELAADVPEGVVAKIDKVELDIEEKNASIKIKQDKLVKGDLESNGNYRVEIYNEYGSSKADPSINTADVAFNETMRVIFTVSGINSGKDYQAYLAYADANWGASNWGYNENGNGSVIVNGEGTYIIDLQTGPGTGAVVFCLDIKGLATDYAEGVNVTVDKIIMDPDDTHSLKPSAGKALFNNKDGNGVDGRIEIYNEYGSTKADPCIDPASISFNKNMAVTYTISGITGNLKEGAPESYVSGLSYADASWDPSYWTDDSINQYKAIVKGDGTYTVWMEAGAQAEGAVVFCVEIFKLWENLVDPTLVTVNVDQIVMDSPMTFDVNHEIINFQNKDGNGTDGRIDIYNEYSNSGAAAAQYYNDKLYFSGVMMVQFTVSGVTGNLVEGAAGSYKADLSYADASWDPSSWGSDYGFTNVTGDGTYTVYAVLPGYCSGAVVWTVELYGLWKDLVDTSKVKVDVKKVVIPGQLDAEGKVVAKSASKVIRPSR